MADYEIFYNEEADPGKEIMFKFHNADSGDLFYYMSLDELENMRFGIDDLIKTLKGKCD